MNYWMEEIMAVMPLKGEVTQEIIDSSSVWDSQNCIGHNTLVASLKQAGINVDELDKIRWFNKNGYITKEHESLYVTTEEPMIRMYEPQSVTFKVYHHEF